MKDRELQFDRTCHVLYSKACKKENRFAPSGKQAAYHDGAGYRSCRKKC